MTLKHVALVIVAVAMSGCAGKIVVTRVSPGTPQPMEGVYYALPRTVVKVDQPIDRIAQQAGTYVAYLPLFFPRIAESGSFVDASSVSFKVNKASISTYGEPDPGQIFYVKVTGNGPVDLTGLIEYTEQGTVSGVSAQADNATTDIVLSVLGTAAGLASKSLGAGRADVQTARAGCAARPTSIPCRIASFELKPIDADRLLATYDGLTAHERQVLDEAAARRKPNFDDALLAYADIYAMQTDRALLRRTPGAFSAEAALKDFDAAIASDLAYAFTGSQAKDTWTYSTDLRDFVLSSAIVLLKVHAHEGLCLPAPLPAGDRPPKPFWFESASYLCDETTIRAGLAEQLKSLDDQASDAARALETKQKELKATLAAARAVTASFALNPASGQAFEQLGAAAQTGERGFYYRIPATADVVLTLGDDPVTRSRQSIAQFGTMASLPASTGGRTTGYALKFYEATGALKSFNVTSKAILQKGTVDALGAQAATLADARRTADDELTKLDRQSKILALKKAIYDNCKALNMACGGFVPGQQAPEK